MQGAAAGLGAELADEVLLRAVGAIWSAKIATSAKRPRMIRPMTAERWSQDAAQRSRAELAGGCATATASALDL